jgi:hypothetical protein
LSKSEISSLLFKQENQTTSLELAVKFLDLTELRTFWRFSEKSLNIDAQKELLGIENKNLWTPLQHSAIRFDPDIFDFMSNIFYNTFSPNEIRGIILKRTPPSFPFIFEVIGNGSIESNLKVANYLENIFETSTEKQSLREFLSFRNSDGHTLFSQRIEDENYHENVEIFLRMLSHTFDTHEITLVDDFLKLIQTPTRVETFFRLQSANFTKLREHPWNTNDFEYFIKNWKYLRESVGNEFNVILTSRDNKSRTLLYELAAHQEIKDLKPFLEILQESLDKNAIKSLILQQEEFYQRNFLMEAVAKRSLDDLKYLYSFCQSQLSKKEMEALFSMFDIYEKTAFHFSVRNKDEKAFRFIVAKYESTLDRSKIRDMMLKVNKNWYPFTYEAFTEGSVGTCREMLNYILDIFKLKTTILRNLLGFLRDKEKAFKDLNVNDLQEKIDLFSGFSADIYGT